jgi:hypothetical protein
MAAKVLFTAKGSDPTTLVWPPAGRMIDRWTFTSGTPLKIPDLIPYGDGTIITYPDGRLFPTMTPQGSTLVHQK